jgi:hypothetical protein
LIFIPPFFLFFQSLICLFSFTIFDLHNSNGRQSLVIPQDDPSGANQKKINTGEILEKYNISPKWKVHMPIPLWRMVPMLVVRHTLKIDILKMEQAFHMGYKGTRFFYLSPTSWKGEE